MSNAQIRTLENYVQLQQQVASYHVIKSATRTGVLSSLGEGQKTDVEIAAACGLEVVPLRLLLGVLVQSGLLEKYEEHYALSQVARLLPDLNEFDDSHWTMIDEWLKGKPDPGPSDGEQLSQQMSDPPWMLTPAAMDAAEVLDMGRDRTGLRVLEVAGGPSVLSAALAHRDPSSTFCIVDLPNGIHQAQETANSIGRADQFEFIAGDPFDPPVSNATIDLILIGGILRRLPGDRCQEWLVRLGELLKPGGEVAILDWFPGQEKGFKNLAFSQLELSLRFRDAGLVTPGLLREWLGTAGLSNIRYANLTSPPHIWGLVLAQKPLEPEVNGG